MKSGDLASTRSVNTAVFIVSGGLVFAAVVACTGNHSAGSGAPQLPRGARVPSDDDERDMRIDLSRLGFDHSLEVRKTKGGVPHELLDGQDVVTGDRVRASVRTTEDAFLYLAFCAHHELAMFPGQGGIQTRAGQTVSVPPGGDLVVAGEPGDEVLYLIVSRTDLSAADPRLAAEVAKSRPSDRASDCGQSLDAKLQKSASGGSATVPRSVSGRVLRGEQRKKKAISADQRVSGRAGRDTAAPAVATVPDTPPPDPGYDRNGMNVWYSANGERGPELVVVADVDGIAVVRYGFKHVVANSP